MKVSYHSLVGHVIRSKRREIGMSLEQIASTMNVGCSGWSKVEKGIVPANIIKLCLFSVVASKNPHEVLKDADNLGRSCISHGVALTVDTLPSKLAMREGFLFGDRLSGFLDGVLLFGAVKELACDA